MNSKQKLISIGLPLLLLESCASAPKNVESPLISSAQVEKKLQDAVRVGGDYRVEKITRHDDQTFRIEFASVAPTGRFDHLVLDSDHVHVAVQEGSIVRLSAEILSEDGVSAEAAQVLLFLPSVRGKTPVWLLSKKGSRLDTSGTRFLEMHAPLTDYSIL